MSAAVAKSLAESRRCQAALLATMDFVEEVAPNCWQVRPNATSTAPLRAQLVDGFLELSGAFSPASPASRWELLKANASLAGMAKFSSAPNRGLRLQAEIPLQVEDNLALRLAQARKAFAAALVPAISQQEHAPAAADEVAPPDLPRLCEEAGWQCSSRRPDRCAVPLASGRGAHTALITAQAGTVQVCTELASWDSLSVTCREGLATLLLSANARLRLARAVVAEDENGGAAQLEVVFEAPATAAEVRCALEALSVGADVCAPLAEIMQPEAAAELFLAIQGDPRDREDSQQRTERKI